MYWPKSLKSLRIVVRKPWRYPPVTETIVAQAPRLGVLGQVADLAPHRRVRGLARSQGLQLVQHNPALAGFEQSSKSAVYQRRTGSSSLRKLLSVFLLADGLSFYGMVANRCEDGPSPSCPESAEGDGESFFYAAGSRGSSSSLRM